jgi:hypothetical protein
VTRPRMTPALAILAALLAAVLALVAVELGKGAADEPGPKLAGSCHSRPGRTGGFDTTVQRLVLEGLDGAACRLHTTREELVLSLAPESGVPRRWDDHTIEVAVRAGLVEAVDKAEQRGDIPGFAAPLVRQLVETAPIDRLIRGGIGLGNLLG